MTGIFATIALSSFFLEVTPEIRSSYQSLGKILEDRPMQVTGVRAGYDTGVFGRFGIRNWDVSSLTDRRADAHRHVLYHTEFGPTWQYDWNICENLTLKNDLTYSWTIYRGFRHGNGDRTYIWVQTEQALENPYLTPFSRLRCCFHGSDYVYFRAGLRKRFGFWGDFYCTPSVYTDGGNGRIQKRNLGEKPDGGKWKSGFTAVTGRLELGWRINGSMTAFGYIEQYGVVGARPDARTAGIPTGVRTTTGRTAASASELSSDAYRQPAADQIDGMRTAMFPRWRAMSRSAESTERTAMSFFDPSP